MRLLHPKVGIPILVAMALVAAPFVYRSRQLVGLPDIGDPFDVRAFREFDVPDEKNAFVEYREAIALLVPEPDIDYGESPAEAMETDWRFAPPELRNWVTDNREALRIWRRGARKPDALNARLRLPDLDAELSKIPRASKGLRDLVRIARLEASRIAVEGNAAEVWTLYRDMLRSSRHLGRHGSTLERHVGAVLFIVTADSIEAWSENPRVDENLLQTALTEVGTAYAASEPASTSFKFAYVVTDEQLDDLCELSSGLTASADFWLHREPELARRIFQHEFTSLLEGVSVGGSVGTVRGHLSPAELEPYIRRSPIARLVRPMRQSTVDLIEREEAWKNALEMALAVQIHCRRHGRLPERADELLGSGLGSIPADPCDASGGKMRFRYDETAGEAVVWSVGDDGVDNGGDVRPAKHDGPAEDVGFRIRVPTEASAP